MKENPPTIREFYAPIISAPLTPARPWQVRTTRTDTPAARKAPRIDARVEPNE